MAQRKNGPKCPHCGSPARIRSSEVLTELASALRYECSDDLGCNHSWLAHLSIVHTVRPSARPNPKIHIPLSTAYRPAAIAPGDPLASLAAQAAQALDGPLPTTAEPIAAAG